MRAPASDDATKSTITCKSEIKSNYVCACVPVYMRRRRRRRKRRWKEEAEKKKEGEIIRKLRRKIKNDVYCLG